MQKCYRQNVAVFVLNENGFLLACQRSDEFKSWQVPQGGIDEGESREGAMRRELLEEIGTADIELIGCLPSSIKYDWPKEHIPGYHGQEQWYYLVRLCDETRIDLRAHAPHEFDSYQWVSLRDFFSLPIGFKEQTYRRALDEFLRAYPGIIREE